MDFKFTYYALEMTSLTCPPLAEKDVISFDLAVTACPASRAYNRDISISITTFTRLSWSYSDSKNNSTSDFLYTLKAAALSDWKEIFVLFH